MIEFTMQRSKTSSTYADDVIVSMYAAHTVFRLWDDVFKYLVMWLLVMQCKAEVILFAWVSSFYFPFSNRI